MECSVWQKRRVVITREMMAFTRENEDTIVDKVRNASNVGQAACVLKNKSSFQILLAEVENVRDMRSAENNDMQKVSSATFCLLFCRSHLGTGGFFERLHDQHYSRRIQ